MFASKLEKNDVESSTGDKKYWSTVGEEAEV